MMNINILNKIVKGVSEQIPLVNSYYTISPYDSWNIKEVKYGSVSFVVTKTTTTEQTTVYDAVLYYGDRLTEDKSNRDSIHSDAATVIQTIVGALNQSDDEFVTVDYPVAITLFEQSFCDDLAGGYANMTITVQGFGECFNDEYSVPEIVGTSAYYTKDEIVELFPLRTQLAKVATTGSYTDLLDIPELVTIIQYNQLINDFNALKNALDSCVDATEYNNIVIRIKEIETALNEKISRQSFTQFADGQNTININLALELLNKVNTAYFETVVANINNELDNRVTKQIFDNLVTDITNKTAALTEAVNDKLSVGYFNEWADHIEKQLAQLPDFDQILSNIKNIQTDLATRPTQQTFDNLYEAIETNIVNLAYEVRNKVSNDEYQFFKSTTTNDIKARVTTQVFDNTVSTINTTLKSLKTSLNGKVDDNFFDTWSKNVISEIENRVTIQGFNQYASNVYTKDEINDKFFNYESYIDLYLKSEDFTKYISDYVTKIVTEFTEEYLSTVLDYYTKQEIDEILSNIDLEGYYNKEQIDDMIANLELENYPTKTEIENNYYKKSETYTKTEIDTAIANVEVDLSAYYTKTEIDATLGNINTILNNVLYTL